MTALIDAPYLSSYQEGDFILSSRMNDMGDNGQTGTADGIAPFLAPYRGRVVDIMGVCETGLDDDATNMRIENITGAGATANWPAIASVAEGEAFTLTLQDTDNVDMERLDVFEVQSDGGSGAAGLGYVYVLFRPNRDQDILTGAFILSGRNFSGVSALDLDWPSLGDVEVLEYQVGNNLAFTVNYVSRLNKNGGTLITTNTHEDGAAGLATSSGRIIDADRFLSKEDHLRVDSTANAGCTGQFPYNIICRRL